ncbi:MAG: NUDIX domain-containing protein [Nanoarchaeota archaeon]|nr:NUDIX domain-containing protein [Nanoarchaeota archaeon]
MEKIIVVDEKDNLLGAKERGSLTKEDIYRVSALWVKNSKEEILLAKRALTKKKDPGLWGPAVAGTVEEGESYEQNILKEAEEELGLKNIKPMKLIKDRTKKPHNHFCQWFFLKLDKEAKKFKIQKEEVEEVKWFSKEEIENLFDKNPPLIIPALKFFIKQIKI